MHCSQPFRLFRAVRVVIRADSDPTRQILFANLAEARFVVRLAVVVHTYLAGTWAATLLIAMYGLAHLLRIAPPQLADARIWSAAKHTNARRQVNRVAAWVGATDCGRVRIGIGSGVRTGSLLALAGIVADGRVACLLRIIRVLNRRHGFLVACRATTALAWYSRTTTMLARHSPGAVLVSSDTNPEEVGFTAAAKAQGVPCVFASHAYPTPLAAPLEFNLSILEGKAAVQAWGKKGAIRGQVVLAGVEGESAPMDGSRFSNANPVIGIFAPKALSWTTLVNVINDCRQHLGARQFVIRWHPSRLDPATRLHRVGDLSDIEESPASASLPDVARRCDWVIADENSNVHLPVLKLGIPTVAIKGLGLYPESRADMYGFARAGIVYPAVDTILDVDVAAYNAFFSKEWTQRFREYDAAYLRPASDIGTEVRSAIWNVVDERSRAA